MKKTCTQRVFHDDRAQKRLADQMSMQTSGEYGKFLIDTDSKAIKLNCGKIPNQIVKRAPKPQPEFKETTDRYYSARLGTPMDLTFNRDTSTQYLTKSTSNFSSNNQTDGSNPFHHSSSNNLNSRSNSAQVSARSDLNSRSDIGSARNSVQLSGRDNFFNSNSHNNFGNSGYGTTTSKTQYTDTLRSLDKQFNNASRRDLFAASLPARSSHEQIYTVAGEFVCCWCCF